MPLKEHARLCCQWHRRDASAQTTARTARLACGVALTGLREEGLVYSITTDIGVFDTGLNLNLCGLLAILGGEEVITDAVRTISLRFNTYNGQMDGLFSSVDITARFTLGKDHHNPGLRLGG